jgi:AraC-like DNA-binding protein
LTTSNEKLQLRAFKATELETSPSAGGAITRLACKYAQDKSVEIDSLLRKAGLSRQQLNDRNIRIHVRKQVLFLNLVAQALGDPLIGLHLSQMFDLRMAGLLYYVPASSETLGEALQRVSRYSSIVNEGIKLTFRSKKSIGLSFDYVGIPRHQDVHQMEFWVTALVRAARQITNQNLPVHGVCFTHKRVAVPEMNTFFGSRVTFGADIDELTFSLDYRKAPIVNADPYLNEILVEFCEETLMRRKVRRSSFGSKVENAIAVLLPHGKAQVRDVAQKLGLTQRTLSRRLATEGLTFAKVRQTLRADLADRHLADKDLSISEIAWLLGYQDVSGFSSAFKRWTGKAPRAIRYSAGCA